MSRCAVLHVTSLPGGGVDRYIRDIAASGERRHLVWHTAATAEVIEIAGERRYFPLDAAATTSRAGDLARWLRSQGVGLVHLHSVSAQSRRRAAWAATTLSIPAVATLHDVLFLRADAFEPGVSVDPDPAWVADTASFLAGASAIVAPSEYLAEVARRHLAGLSIEVIENGSEIGPRKSESPNKLGTPAPGRHIQFPHPDFTERRIPDIAIVLGAIGPHKGARVLEETARLLADSSVAIVILGYLDAQIERGWRSDHLYIHGPCGDDEVAALVEGYGGRVALFPNTVPESFSYALSDLWSAGLPAIVPPEGALAQRLTRHGGGWLLPAGFGAAEVAAMLKRLLSREGAGELARVKSMLRADPDRVPSLAHMTRSLDALYDRFGIDPTAAVETQSQPARELLAHNLDGALFRQELARAADELVQLKTGLEQERAAAARFSGEAREWIAKLERDVAQLQSQLAAEVDERRRLGAENGQLANRIAELEIHKSAFDLLPRFIRSMLLKRVRNARD